MIGSIRYKRYHITYHWYSVYPNTRTCCNNTYIIDKELPTILVHADLNKKGNCISKQDAKNVNVRTNGLFKPSLTSMSWSVLLCTEIRGKENHHILLSIPHCKKSPYYKTHYYYCSNCNTIIAKCYTRVPPTSHVV